MSAGGGAEGGVRAAQGGDEDAAKQPEGQGRCRVLIVPILILAHYQLSKTQ